MSSHEIARESRLKVLDLLFAAQTSHIGSLLGAADIFAVLFERLDLDKDRFVLAAGWKAALLYFHLWKKARITEEQLNSYCQADSEFIGLAEPIHPDVPIAGGSMGLGLPGAVGIAMAKKLKKESGRVYCLMSDGEMQIGTTWESALIAHHHALDNLVVFVDVNGLQAMGATKDILDLGSLMLKFASFGWSAEVVDGHDHHQLAQALGKQSHGPRIIIAKTTKGKGWKRAEGNNLYHYKGLSQEEYDEAVAEISHG